MSSMYKAFEQSKDLAREGTYMDLGDFRIKIAYAGETNPTFTKQMSNMHKVHGRAIFGGTLPEEKQRELFVKVYAETVIVDWEVKRSSIKTTEPAPVGTWDNDATADGDDWVRGIHARDGSLLPFNKDNVYAALMELPLLFREVKSHAENADYYKQSLIEDIVKN